MMTDGKKTPRGGVTPELEDDVLDVVTGGAADGTFLYRCPNCGYEYRGHPTGMIEGSNAPWCPCCAVIDHCNTRMIKVG